MIENMEIDFFSELKASLEEAVAFAQGDESKCRVSVRQLPALSRKSDEAARKRLMRNVQPAK